MVEEIKELANDRHRFVPIIRHPSGTEVALKPAIALKCYKGEEQQVETAKQRSTIGSEPVENAPRLADAPPLHWLGAGASVLFLSFRLSANTLTSNQYQVAITATITNQKKKIGSPIKSLLPESSSDSSS